jgi:hypothetical protein
MTKKPPALPANAELVDDLDRAAKMLLGAAFPDNSLTTEPKSEDIGKQSLQDQIRAFAAISHWAIERTKIVAPPPAEKGKGERLRERFHSRAVGRGNGSTEGEETKTGDGS